MNFLLDTCVISEVTKPRPSPEVLALIPWLLYLRDEGLSGKLRRHMRDHGEVVRAAPGGGGAVHLQLDHIEVSCVNAI